MLRHIHISVIETTPKSQSGDLYSTHLTLTSWHYSHVGELHDRCWWHWKWHLCHLCVLLTDHVCVLLLHRLQNIKFSLRIR